MHDRVHDASEMERYRFDWIDIQVPEDHWSGETKQKVADAMLAAGSAAVNSGEFGRLEQLYTEFSTLYPKLLYETSDIDRGAAIYSLLYLMLWRRTQVLFDLKTFNVDVVAPFSEFISYNFEKRVPQLSSRNVPRIAYLTESKNLDGANAVGRITASLMMGQQQLRDSDNWPYLYCINEPLESLLNFASEQGIQVRNMARTTPTATAEAVINQAIADDIDILISDNSSAVATIAFQRRAAPVQAFHENGFAAWAISELDLIFLGITKSASGLVSKHVQVVRTPRNTAHIFQRIARPSESIESFRNFLAAESGVSSPSTVYGVYGRMAKVTKEYMCLVERILINTPNSIFFAGGTGVSSAIYESKRTSPVGSRMVVLNEFVDGHIVSECIDVFLDTFPFPGGMSCIEAQARNVPVVWMASQTQEGFAIIAEQRDEALSASSGQEYVDLAIGLDIHMKREQAGEIAGNIAKKFGDMTEQAKLVEHHLSEVWGRTRVKRRSAR
jgi:predicted O-linked N-acetylglucosamine transferase (SPINDLY family)